MNRFIEKNKRHIVRIGILLGIYVLLVLLLTRFKYAYGSTLDWAGQHYAIPDYFRKLFYETGEFFPSFAPNIGAGENIYYFSYYGLYSPFILFSYLLPFVKMSTYLQAASMVGIAADIIIFYIFMNRKFRENTAFLLSAVFLLSDSLIFHSHRHVMFVNYMPFLLLALMAVEDYFFKGKKTRLIVFCFLIIISSYYFSIPALIAVAVYGVYCYLKTTEKVKLKEFLKTAVRFAGRLFISVMMAGVLLLPTAAAMLGGRDGGNSHINIFQLLPKVSLNYISSGHYSMGLSCFLVTACIIGFMAKDKARRFICIVMAFLICCPVFVFALNGGMYIDPKVLIPFVPIATLIIGEAFEDLVQGRYKFKFVFPATLIVLALGIVSMGGGRMTRLGIYADSVILIICLICFYKLKKRGFIVFSMLALSCISMVASNFSDKLVTYDEIKKNDSYDLEELADIVAKNDGLFRTINLFNSSQTVNMVYNMGFYSTDVYSSLHNKNFNNFYFNEIKNENEYRNSALTTASRNVLFNMYMGSKYLISDKESAPTGYERIKVSGNLNLYKNDNVYPIGYVSSKIMGEEEYKALDYPYNVEALMNYVIVPKAGASGFKSSVEKINGVQLEENDRISTGSDGYLIESREKFSQTVRLDRPLTKDKVLMLRFNVDNTMRGHRKDVKITVNGIKNKLTSPDWKYYNNNRSFEYTLTTDGEQEINEITFEFSKGKYEVSDIEAYFMDLPTVGAELNGIMEDENDSGVGDKVIKGAVSCKQDGWFNLSIPYDEGFKVIVDGEDRECQRVDTSFIGFPLEKGEHEIEIIFKAPFLREGKILSIAGFILLIAVGVLDCIRRKNNNHS